MRRKDLIIMKTNLWPRWKSLNGNASRGQTLALVVVMIPTLLAITALSIDTGRLWMVRRALQNSVDAAALAGAWSLPDDTAEAIQVACDYGTVKNAVPEMSGALCDTKADVEISTSTFGGLSVPNGKITVTSERVVVPTLGSVLPDPLKFDPITVSAHASAVIGSIHTLCIFPLFQTQNLLEASGAWQPNGAGDFIQFNVPMVMKTSSSDNASGNFLYLQANGSSSKSDIRGAIGSPDGCTGGEVTDTATTATGNVVGPLDQGMETRRGHYMNSAQAGYCPDPAPTYNAEGVAIHPYKGGEPITPENCYRLVQFPLLEGNSTQYNGTTSARIRGFLTFYVSNWCGQSSVPPKGSGSDSQHCAAPAGTGLPELKWGELWGYYLRYEAASKDPIQAYDGLGTKVVVLVE